MSAWPDPRAGLLRANATARGGDEAARGRDGARGGGAAALTLDDLILRRAGDASAGASANVVDAGARGTGASGTGASGTLFSRARAPVVVTGWANPHAGGDEARDGARGRDGVDRAFSDARDRRGAGRQPLELAGRRNAVGVVRDAVDYNAGYLSPDEVNADLDGPPSPVRGFAQRLMSLDASPTPRGKHSRKRGTTNRSAEPDGAYEYEQRRKRARRAAMKEAEALAAAARRMPVSPGSDSGAPGSASRSGRALRAPGAFWTGAGVSRDERSWRQPASPPKRGRGRPPKNAKRYSPPSSEDEYEDFGGAEEGERGWSEDKDAHARGGRAPANAARALNSIRGHAAPTRRQPQAPRERGTRKGKPGPKPGVAAAKKAAMIAAGIPIPVLPPGVKRGRGRPPKSMLIIPDGPPNAKLPDTVIRSIAEVDPRVIEKVKPELFRAVSTTNSALRSSYVAPPLQEERTACIACGRVDGEDRMLLCDGCDKGYHTHCLVPRLDKVPENEWFCYECVTQNRPKTAAAEAFERRQASKARFAPETTYDECQRVSDKLKLNGERKLKPGPKPGSKMKKNHRRDDEFDDDRYAAAPSTEKRPVGRPKKDPNAWSDEQLEALQNAQVRVDLGRKNFWTEVASYVPGKTAQQCKEQVYAGLNIGADDADDADRSDTDEDVEDTPHNQHQQRTFRTPTKPNSSRENAERWRNRAPQRS
jgi:hypothetical protein|tara:strand:- start:1957 stop:4074 length:2118 start_codon:yes stop_codon:yes gene_type:complete